jgi:hypothetical protein
VGKVPESLAVHITMLRTALRRAGMHNWRALNRDITSCAEALRYYAKSTPEIEACLVQVTTRCNAFAQYVSEKGPIYSPNDSEAQRLRKKAGVAIDALEGALEGAEPSDEARDLNVPW